MYFATYTLNSLCRSNSAVSLNQNNSFKNNLKIIILSMIFSNTYNFQCKISYISFSVLSNRVKTCYAFSWSACFSDSVCVFTLAKFFALWLVQILKEADINFRFKYLWNLNYIKETEIVLILNSVYFNFSFIFFYIIFVYCRFLLCIIRIFYS